MEYQYNQISCFYSKGERILLIPKGELLPFGGGIDIDPVFEVKAPFDKQELEQKVNECFSLCWSKIVNGIPKGPSIIEKYLNIKGFKKIVQQFEYFDLTYNKVEKKYSLITSVQDKFIRGTPVGKNRHAAAYVLREEVLQTI